MSTPSLPRPAVPEQEVASDCESADDGPRVKVQKLRDRRRIGGGGKGGGVPSFEIQGFKGGELCVRLPIDGDVKNAELVVGRCRTLRFKDGHVYIRDNGSTGGTFLVGVKLHPGLWYKWFCHWELHFSDKADLERSKGRKTYVLCPTVSFVIHTYQHGVLCARQPIGHHLELRSETNAPQRTLRIDLLFQDGLVFIQDNGTTTVCLNGREPRLEAALEADVPVDKRRWKWIEGVQLSLVDPKSGAGGSKQFVLWTSALATGNATANVATAWDDAALFVSKVDHHLELTPSPFISSSLSPASPVYSPSLDASPSGSPPGHGCDQNARLPFGVATAAEPRPAAHAAGAAEQESIQFQFKNWITKRTVGLSRLEMRDETPKQTLADYNKKHAQVLMKTDLSKCYNVVVKPVHLRGKTLKLTAACEMALAANEKVAAVLDALLQGPGVESDGVRWTPSGERGTELWIQNAAGQWATYASGYSDYDLNLGETQNESQNESQHDESQKESQNDVQTRQSFNTLRGTRRCVNRLHQVRDRLLKALNNGEPMSITDLEALPDKDHSGAAFLLALVHLLEQMEEKDGRELVDFHLVNSACLASAFGWHIDDHAEGKNDGNTYIDRSRARQLSKGSASMRIAGVEGVIGYPGLGGHIDFPGWAIHRTGVTSGHGINMWKLVSFHGVPPSTSSARPHRTARPATGASKKPRVRAPPRRLVIARTGEMTGNCFIAAILAHVMGVDLKSQKVPQERITEMRRLEGVPTQHSEYIDGHAQQKIANCLDVGYIVVNPVQQTAAQFTANGQDPLILKWAVLMQCTGTHVEPLATQGSSGGLKCGLLTHTEAQEYLDEHGIRFVVPISLGESISCSSDEDGGGSGEGGGKDAGGGAGEGGGEGGREGSGSEGGGGEGGGGGV